MGENHNSGEGGEGFLWYGGSGGGGGIKATIRDGCESVFDLESGGGRNSHRWIGTRMLKFKRVCSRRAAFWSACFLMLGVPLLLTTEVVSLLGVSQPSL